MKICVIGTGYVGLVTGAGFAELGNEVVCVDIDAEKINHLKQGKLPFYEEGLDELITKNVARKRLSFTTSLAEAASSAKIIFVAVGTPSRADGEADLSFIIQVAESLIPLLHDYKIIAIKSTVPVGTLKLFSEILELGGKKKGAHFDIASTPEFLREGDAVYDFFHPSRTVLGYDKPEVGKVLHELFLPLKSPILHTTSATAQMIKYAANTFLATRISFINEIANICEKVGADVMEVAQGIGYDKRLGEGYLRAGVGFGGPCLVKDLKALIRLAEENGYEARFLKSVLEKNEHQMRQIIYKTKQALQDVLYGKTIALLGLTFKAGTSDVRNSLSLKILKHLKKEGAKIKAYDPKGMEEAKHIIPEVTFTSDAYEAALDSHILLILTAWEEFATLDFEKLKKTMKQPLIIDGVNLLDADSMRKLGFVYQGVGRG
ncbi:UDP-glucose/GDP-mannose dehydrogenase family protein [Candidatus Aerophobetes bacterium]|nr:UDP-glucose/GDP-mannose dehydrogenase family protein [Candidatus Aerophobetes bacterium]